MYFLRYSLVIVFIFLNLDFRSEGRNNFKVHFPAANSTHFPRLRLKSTLPNLHEFTFCSWVRPEYIRKGVSIILSYATTVSHDELTILLYKTDERTVISFHLRSSYRDYKCSDSDWEIGAWKHFCVTWFGPGGKSELLLNGEMCKVVKHEHMEKAKGRLIKGGGTLMMGKNHHSDGSVGKLDQGWRGDFADFQMWDEVLDKNQMVEAGKCENKRIRGNVISFMRTPLIPKEGVVISSTNLCKE